MPKSYNNYPRTARNRAAAALKHKEKNGTSCGTPVGWRRASQISKNQKLTLSVIKRTFSFLSRAKTYDQGKFTDDKGKDICGSIMYAAWGGDSMKNWAERIINRQSEKRNVSSAVEKGLKNKMEKHNKSVTAPTKKATMRMLKAVFRRGIGAYKTNPQSVRPSVKSPEQWAYARVSSFLYALKNERFRSGKHDTDLFPKGHKLSSKK
tara:strand:- start:96 stop:716 length:621 start_codon:yes stop_codon:yes gene_type:complete